jgi:hypothetical protein
MAWIETDEARRLATDPEAMERAPNSSGVC